MAKRTTVRAVVLVLNIYPSSDSGAAITVQASAWREREIDRDHQLRKRCRIPYPKSNRVSTAIKLAKTPFWSNIGRVLETFIETSALYGQPGSHRNSGTRISEPVALRF